MENFDFKKVQRELIRRELRPILYEQGFVLSKPTTYIRERDGQCVDFHAVSVTEEQRRMAESKYKEML